ncbi:MAG: hypothetical protein ACREJ3_03060 [Polyangiaceae bacterium]
MYPLFVVPRSLRRAALLVLTVGCGGSGAVGGDSDGGAAMGDATVHADYGDASSDAIRGYDGAVASQDGSGTMCPDIGDASLVATGRIPINHRPSGAACPSRRAAVIPVACGCPDGGRNELVRPDGSVCLCGSCGQDSDCDAGANGRCGESGPALYLGCSYDGCFSDSDCAGGVPCECRPSATSGWANVCQPGSNCAVDSNCGPGGYCSPSLVDDLCFCQSTALCPDSGTECTANGNSVLCACGDSCAHGYFCHTPCDTCVDDSDCGNQGTCNYDVVDRRWECNDCVPVP